MNLLCSDAESVVYINFINAQKSLLRIALPTLHAWVYDFKFNNDDLLVPGVYSFIPVSPQLSPCDIKELGINEIDHTLIYRKYLKINILMD